MQTLTLYILSSLTSVEGLSGSAPLQTLTLNSLSSLTSVAGLSGCAALQALTLKDLPIPSLTSGDGLSGCAALQTLTLQNLPIPSLTSVKGLSGCAALQTLTLESLSSLTSVEGLSGCAALQTLTLYWLSLTSVEVLSGRAALQTLTLTSLGSLTSVEGLSGGVALQTRTLQDLPIPSLTSVEGLSGYAALQRADLTMTKGSLGPAEGTVLAHLVRESKVLTSVSVSGMSMPNEVAQKLSAAVLSSKPQLFPGVPFKELREDTLIELDLGAMDEMGVMNMRIGRAGSLVLAELLKDCTKLTSLNLKGHSLGENGLDDGPLAIVEALKVNSTISVVDLTQNALSHRVVDELISMFRTHKTLTSLCGIRPDQTHLDVNNGVGTGSSSDPALIAADLEFNRVLTHVKLSNSGCGSQSRGGLRGVNALADVLRDNPVVTHVNLWNSFYQNDPSELASVLAKFQALGSVEDWRWERHHPSGTTSATLDP